MELWFIRHGQTDWNKEGRVQGWLDVPLNSSGVNEAKRLATFLKGISVDRMYSSDLMRARETGNILRMALECPMTLNPLLRERRFGPLEGRLRQTSLHIDLNPLNDEYVPIAPLPRDEESESSIRHRAETFLTQILKEQNAERIMAITHGGFIRAVLRVVHVAPPTVINNASITRLKAVDTGWEVMDVNWIGHLLHSSNDMRLESDLIR